MSTAINPSQQAYAGGVGPEQMSTASQTKESQTQVEVPKMQNSASQAEVVSLSSDASLGTQLLQSARDSDGVDVPTVQRVKGAIQEGTYNIAPSKLAQAMLGAIKELV